MRFNQRVHALQKEEEKEKSVDKQTGSKAHQTRRRPALLGTNQPSWFGCSRLAVVVLKVRDKVKRNRPPQLQFHPGVCVDKVLHVPKHFPVGWICTQRYAAPRNLSHAYVSHVTVNKHGEGQLPLVCFALPHHKAASLNLITQYPLRRLRRRKKNTWEWKWKWEWGRERERRNKEEEAEEEEE